MMLSHSPDALPRSAPEAQGIASRALLAFLEEAEETLEELHSFQLLRHGHIIAEGWWAPYAAERPHLLFSLTKSFTATAAGLAIAAGLLSLDDAVLSFFPEDAPGQVSANLAAMQIRHLLSMSTGHEQDTTARLFERQDGNSAKAFLSLPVERVPGTHFVYNSGASHIVSAILQKVTGMKLRDYLQPRLFTPLGIQDPLWETDAQGVNMGGWGLRLKTDEIGRFGQLYLQKGVWNGVRLLPEGWTEEATAFHISNGDRPDSNWSQGYGFQFWRCRHGAYRGDGAFGQFCVVLPEQDAVLAFTAGTGDMQAVLNLVWKRLLPAMSSEPLAEDRAAQEALRQRLARLTLKTPPGQAASPLAAKVSGQTYRFEKNSQNIEAVTFEFGAEETVLRVVMERGEQRIVCGAKGDWRLGRLLDSPVDSPGEEARLVAASGAWLDEETYAVKFCFCETPFCPTVTYRFGDDRLLLDYRANVAFGPLERPHLTGRREARTALPASLSTMQVPRFAGEGRIVWDEKPVPAPGPGQLLLAVRANALCGSERGQFRNGSLVTPGHETAGVVVAAGPNTSLAAGAPGVVFLMDFCGACRSCRCGATNQCLRKRGDMGFTRDGGYGPYELVHENIFFPVDADLPLSEATLLLDIMGTGSHALARGRQVVPAPEALLIMGAGPIGLGALAMARLLLGPDVPIVVTDRISYRLELAARLGGSPVDVSHQSLAAGAKAAGMDSGFDLALDTTGNGEALRDALGTLGRRAALVCVGHGAQLPLNVSGDLIAPEAALVGSEYFRFDALPANLALLRSHRDYLGQIITHRFPAADIQRAFETFFGGETGKVVVERE